MDSPRAAHRDPALRQRLAADVTVRPARRGETVPIRRLVALYPDELLQTGLPGIPSFFVAERDGVLVGCCALEIYSKRLAEVRSLAVHPNFMGKGVGGQLVRACLGRARRRGVRQLLAVTSEPSFFEGHGFTVHSGWKTAVFADPSDLVEPDPSKRRSEVDRVPR